MSNAAFVYANYVKAATVTASSAAANFPASNLATSDQGAASEGWQTAAGVLTSVTLTITPTVGAQTWRVVSIHRSNLTAAATGTFKLFNNPSTLVATVNWTGPVGATGQVVGVFSQNFTADYATVTFNDSTNPDGHINVALACAGAVWMPATGFSFSDTFDRASLLDETRARGGGEYPVFRYQQRLWNLELQGVRSSEVWVQLDSMQRTSRLGGNILVIPDTTSANLQFEAVFGRITNTQPVSFPYGAADRRAWRGTISERL